MPLLPLISDTDEKLEEVFSAVKNAGADYILPAGLTLFGNEAADSKTLYFKFLEKYYPQLITQYKKCTRSFLIHKKIISSNCR
ncbi:MAG: hypothetical protein LH473_09620 [Chitinophagales bacterium]|nr:hypothetical protein [Chitinophagales bacterium]